MKGREKKREGGRSSTDLYSQVQAAKGFKVILGFLGNPRSA